MGISMNSATYARDDAGLRKLKSEFSSDMTRTRNALRDYNNIFKAIDKEWSGADADRFKANFKDTVEQIIRKVNTYEQKVLAVLDEDARQFRANQNRIASSLNKINLR